MTVSEDHLSVSLPVAAATPLAYALVDRIASKNEVRVLAIKGPLLEKFGLRSQKLSSDADILVEPSKMTEFCELLGTYGWRDRDVRYSPSILDPHSRTLIHDEWPTDIDVHSYFPGFFGDPSEVFDLLWGERIKVEIAGVSIWTASRVSNAVIALLHILRGSQTVERDGQYREIMAALTGSLNESEMASLTELARVGRIRKVLERELRTLGVGGTFDDLEPADLTRWELNRSTSAQATTGGWLYAISAAGWRAKTALLLRAVYPSAAELRKDPGLADSGRLRLVAIRFRRLARGMYSLPAALGSMIRNRGK